MTIDEAKAIYVPLDPNCVFDEREWEDIAEEIGVCRAAESLDAAVKMLEFVGYDEPLRFARAFRGTTTATSPIFCSAWLMTGEKCGKPCVKKMHILRERLYWTCPTHGFEMWATTDSIHASLTSTAQ